MNHSLWFFRQSWVLGLTLIFGSFAASAESPTEADNSRPDLLAIIAAVEKGWETADGAPFRDHFLDVDGARYVESGGQNLGLQDLIEHHVEPEGDALAGLDLAFTNIETHVDGDFAWAIADVEVKAIIRKDERVIHNRGYQTFLFRRIDGDWKVVHTHSSSRPVKKK